MAITVLFTPASMNAQQYDEIIRRLEAAGVGAPHGRQYHVCFGSGDRLRVLDVWDSAETFDAFARTLIPIVAELGVDPGQPEISTAHNLIAGRPYLDLSEARIGDRPQANKEVVRRLIEGVWRHHDATRVDELVSPDYVDHDPAIRDLQGLKQFVAAVLAAFPDIEAIVEEQLAEGELVATRWSTHGTQRGEFMGVPATGRHGRVSGLTIDRVVNGKIVEEWTQWDKLGLMQQLGVVPAMAAAAQ